MKVFALFLVLALTSAYDYDGSDSDLEEDPCEGENCDGFERTPSTLSQMSPSLKNIQITSDVEAIRSKVEEGDFSSTLLEEIESDLDGIEKDAGLLATKHDPASRAKVKQAMKLRLQVLNSLLNHGKDHAVRPQHAAAPRPQHAAAPRPQHAAAPRATDGANIVADANALSSKIREMHVPAKVLEEAMANLQGIKDDVRMLESATGDRRNQIKEALSLRAQAMHDILGMAQSRNPPSVAHAPAAAYHAPAAAYHAPRPSIDPTKKVMSDLTRIEGQVKSSHLAAGAKKEAMDNLHKFEEDVRKFQAASPDKQVKLKKAMSFRYKALQEELKNQ